jgi:hypothetical protein
MNVKYAIFHVCISWMGEMDVVDVKPTHEILLEVENSSAKYENLYILCLKVRE